MTTIVNSPVCIVQEVIDFHRNHDHKLVKTIMGRDRDPRTSTLVANAILDIFDIENKKFHSLVNPLLDAAQNEGKKIENDAQYYVASLIADEHSQIIQLNKEIRELSEKRNRLEEHARARVIELHNNYIAEHKDRIIKLFELYRDTAKNCLVDRTPHIVELCNEKISDIETRYKNPHKKTL